MNGWIKVLLLAYTMSAVVCFGHAYKFFDEQCQAGVYKDRLAGCAVGEKAIMVSVVWPGYVSYILWSK